MSLHVLRWWSRVRTLACDNLTTVSTTCCLVCSLDELLCLEETFQVSHLPEAGAEQDNRLRNCPPEDSLVRALTRLSEAFLPVLQQTIAHRQNKILYMIHTVYTEIKF